MRPHLDFFVWPVNHLPLLSGWVLQTMLCSLPWSAVSPPKQLLVLSISLITLFFMPSQTRALFCCTIVQKENISLAKGTCSHLETLWKTGSFLVRPHTIQQETCHLTKGHKPQNTKKNQGKKLAPHLNGLLCYHKTGKLAQNSDRFQKLKLHSRSREACLPAGTPSGIFAVKTQDEPNWWHLFSFLQTQCEAGKRGIINKTQVSTLLLLQKGSRQIVDICPPPHYSKQNHADPKTGRNSLAGWPLYDTTRKVL